MPPTGVWYAGRGAIQRALQNFVFVSDVKMKLIPTSANEHPAFGIYRGDGEPHQAFGILLPIFAGDAIVEITAFLSPRLVGRFGLEMSLRGGA